MSYMNSLLLACGITPSIKIPFSHVFFWENLFAMWVNISPAFTRQYDSLYLSAHSMHFLSDQNNRGSAKPRAWNRPQKIVKQSLWGRPNVEHRSYSNLHTLYVITIARVYFIVILSTFSYVKLLIILISMDV